MKKIAQITLGISIFHSIGGILHKKQITYIISWYQHIKQLIQLMNNHSKALDKMMHTQQWLIKTSIT